MRVHMHHVQGLDRRSRQLNKTPFVLPDVWHGNGQDVRFNNVVLKPLHSDVQVERPQRRPPASISHIYIYIAVYIYIYLYTCIYIHI